jgi:dimethylamine/trimethylamine dehydrogenase
MVLGRRGMRRVHLVDADRELGGHLRWLTQLPGLGQWARIVNYRRIQLDKLRNVELVPASRLDATRVLEYGADIVVLATGATWSADGLNGVTRGSIPGADATTAHVLTPEQIILEGKRPPGRRVVVYDCDGYVVGSGLAELLRLEGFDVELVTPYATVAFETDSRLEGVLLREHLEALGIRLRAEATIVEITAAGARLERGSDLEADGVVLATQRLAEESLYLELAAGTAALEAHGIAGLYRVGDCVAPRVLADAVFDGHRLGREIDSPDPATPLPYAREAWPTTRVDARRMVPASP